MGMLDRLTQTLRAQGAFPGRHRCLDLVRDTLGPALASAPEFETILGPALDFALEYFEGQIEAIPGPFPIATAAHAGDPFLAALFPAREDIMAAFGRSVEVKNFLPTLARDGHACVHALLGVRRRADGERQLFADHTLRNLAPTHRFARESLARSALARLLNGFRDHVDRRRQQDKLSRIEWDMGNLIPAAAAPAVAREFAAGGDDLAPARLVRDLAAWLHDPACVLQIGEGVAVAAGEGNVRRLPALRCADRRQWIVCHVELSVAEALHAIAAESRVHRYIFI